MVPRRKEQVADKTIPLRARLPGFTDDYRPELKAPSASELETLVVSISINGEERA